MKNAKPIIFYIFLFFFCIAITTISGMYDFDIWARLIAGMGAVQTGHVIEYDFLSYTPTHIWFDHEWGSGVIFYLTQHLFSGAGLIVLQGVLLFMMFFTVVQIVRLRGVKTTTPYNFLFYYFAYQAISINIEGVIRCQVFSFLFFAIFLYILELARSGKNKQLILLPFLMIIWNNLHGGCVSGIGLIVLFIIGETLNRAPVKKYIFALIPTCLALLINPWGASYLKFLFDAATMKRPDVVEWWGLFSKYHVKDFMKFKIFAAIILISGAFALKKISYKELDKTKILVLLVTLILAIQHIKMIPFFTIAAVSYLYDDFYTFFNNSIKGIKSKIKSKNFALKKEIAIYLLFSVFILSNLGAKSFNPGVNMQKYAAKEVEFIKTNNIKGKLLISFGQGSYAAYKLYPDNLIYMDGRYEEVYDPTLLPLMRRFYLQEPRWEELFEKYPPDVIVMEKTYPAYLMLSGNKDWTLIYKGKYWGVFVSAKDKKKTYKMPSNDPKYYRKNLFDTNINFTNYVVPEQKTSN